MQDCELKYKMKLLSFVYFIVIAFCEGVVLPSIPTHLLQCYQGGGPVLSAPKRLDVFLSLIRRLEDNSSLDLRLLSTNLLRSLRLDGIEEASNAIETEFVLPYRASAFQFHRYRLLMELFLPSQDLINVDESLSLVEKCLLHKMLSSTVQRWERGDENLVCPLSVEQRQTLMTQTAERLNSRCPIENGVIQTDWGTISPGTVVATIAAAVESQRVFITDILNANIFKEEVSQAMMEDALEDWDTKAEAMTVDDVDVTDNAIGNIWVASLAGDIAEVVVNQGLRAGTIVQRFAIGSNNRWNDTLLPRDYYMFPPNETLIDWQLTDAEILAGVDGLILASYVPRWLEQRRSLRLSQLIEMYYSNEGVSFDQNIRACNRQTLYSSIVDNSDLMDETFKFASILSIRQITVYIPKDEMRKISEAAVTAFNNYVLSVLREYHRDCQPSRSVPVVDLVVATDSSWKGYEVQQFISWIGGSLEIDAKRSTISLLQGNTGEWIVPPVNNLTSFFSRLDNMTVEWPNRLNLPNVISRIISYSRNQTLLDISNMASAGHSTVVLIVTPTDRPSAPELERARSLMSSLRSSYFDVYFAYIADDLTDYQNINNEYLDYSELFLTVSSSLLSDVIEAVNTYLVESVIPNKIFGPQCTVNETEYPQLPFEDYVLPGREQSYRIHPFYMRQQPIVNVQFRNDGHGRILVCSWRGGDTSHVCRTIAERDIYAFNLTNPCPSPDFCPPANFLVTGISTNNMCAHKDCRLPNQVGYYIQHSGFRCLPLLGSADIVSPFWKVQIGLSLMISLIYLYQ